MGKHMERVQGYLTEDGTFYRTSAEARRHEAKLIIAEYCAHNSIKSVNKMLETIEALADPIMDYLNANNEVRLQEQEQYGGEIEEDTARAGGDQTGDD